MITAYDPTSWLWRNAPQPAAGVGFSIRPDTRAGWLLHNLAFRFVASGAVANRSVLLSAGDANVTWWRGGAAVVQAAGSDVTYVAFGGSTEDMSALGVTYVAWPMAGLWVPQGAALTASVTNIDAADQFSAIVFVAQEIPATPPPLVAQDTIRLYRNTPSY
jgi:hypothetical protein